MNKLSFQLVTPERTVLSEELVSLTCPTNMGYITILPDHEPLVATLTMGELHAKAANGKDSYLFVAGGFVQINPGSKVIVLADQAEHHFEIDIERAEEARKRAEKELAGQSKMSNEEYAAVAAALSRSLGRLSIRRKHAHRKGQSDNDGI